MPLPQPKKDLEDLIDPNDSDAERDQLRDQTLLHAKPSRLEDEGQSGG